jgi:uncharacterized protein
MTVRRAKKKRAAPKRAPRSSEPAPAPLVVRRSRINGRGAFATRDIEAGERIIEYSGERILKSEGDRRYGDAIYTALFELDAKTFIDGSIGGNDSRFINHSCAPNCEAVGWRGGVMIKASKRIRAGDELTYDYGLPRDPAVEAAEEEAQYPCRCGARTCRGTILQPAPKKPRRRRTARRS